VLVECERREDRRALGAGQADEPELDAEVLGYRFAVGLEVRDLILDGIPRVLQVLPREDLGKDGRSAGHGGVPLSPFRLESQRVREIVDLLVGWPPPS
jgi:hypothetical protein